MNDLINPITEMHHQRNLWLKITKWIIVKNLMEYRSPYDDNCVSKCLNRYLCAYMYVYKIMYVIEWWTVFALTRGLFWCLFAELHRNEGNKHQNNTRASTWIVHHKNKYIILFLTEYNESINDDQSDDVHTWSLSLTRLVYILLVASQSIADDITITRQLWCKHMKIDL